MKLEMKKFVLDVTNEETYKASLSELFEYDDDAVTESFYKHYSIGAGVGIGEVVKDAFNLTGTEVHNFTLHELSEKQVLLVVAYMD